MDLALVVHGHFYQPPRENPWTETTPVEPSAAPFRDWNSRITAECYRPNGRARLLDEAGRVVEVVDNYRLLSFNVGPTLLSWLEVHAPDVYRRILTADGAAGRAIAQAYGHAILPLCNDPDLRTHIRWGIADFRYRFGRAPAGMWLPETAVDRRVLAALAEEGIGFTILAPGQVDPRIDPTEGDGGRGRSDHREPVYRWRHPERSELGLDLVVYDGDLSHDVAFGGVASPRLLDRVVESARAGRGLVTVACDGETFGHHHAFAERGMAHALAVEAPGRGVAVPGLVEWLKAHPPTVEAEVHTSAWSCAHGVGRWLEDCGCSTGGEPGWHQRWRAPLRAALDIVRDHAASVFERRGAGLLRDPWAARDAYVEVLLGAKTVEQFAVDHLRDEVRDRPEAHVDALTLLEAQRHALLMYASCGWFFNDLAGIETRQILRYAARCCDLLAELGDPAPEEAFLATLADAESNRPEEGNGRDVWARHVEPARVDPIRAAARLGLAALTVEDLVEVGSIARAAGFAVVHEALDRAERPENAHIVRVASGRVRLTHLRTRRATTWTYAGLHTTTPGTDLEPGGTTEVTGEPSGPVIGVRPADDLASDDRALADLAAAVERGEPSTVLRDFVLDRFGHRTFTDDEPSGPGRHLHALGAVPIDATGLVLEPMGADGEAAQGVAPEER